MGIVIDIVIVAILILNILSGYKKGLINVIFSICAFLIAIVATLLLFKPVSNIIIENTNVEAEVKSAIMENLIKENTESKEKKDETSLQKYIEKKISDVAEEAKNDAAEVIADSIAYKSIQILTALALFIAIRIVLIVLKLFTSTIENIPIIKQFNKAGGLLYGVIKGCVTVIILMTIMFLVISINGSGIIAEAINNSIIAKFLYDNNIIVKIFFKS